MKLFISLLLLTCLAGCTTQKPVNAYPAAEQLLECSNNDIDHIHCV